MYVGRYSRLASKIATQGDQKERGWDYAAAWLGSDRPDERDVDQTRLLACAEMAVGKNCLRVTATAFIPTQADV